MDFAFAQNTTKYDRMMRTIHSYRGTAAFANPVGICSINPLFSPAHHTGLQQARNMLLLVQPIFKLYNNWYGR